MIPYAHKRRHMPHAPDVLTPYVRTILRFALVLLLALLIGAPTASAAAPPVAAPIVITTVAGDAGFYAIATADGRIAMVLPASTRTPVLATGLATFYPTTMELRQGKAAYRVKWIRKAVTK